MRILFTIDNNPKCTLWDGMWSKRSIEQELEATEIETAPRVMFLKYLKKEDKIIDAGCGFGKWVIYLHRLGYDIKGVDNNDLAITKLKEHDNSISIEYGDILNLNYPDNYFDAFISMGVIEHFEGGPIPALKEAYRVLKPNGLIFVSTPTVNMIRKLIIQPILNLINANHKLLAFPLLVIKQRWIKKSKKELKKRKRYYHFLEYRFTIKELQTFIRNAKFEVIQTIPHDFPGSKDHAIGLAVDFPFLKDPYGYNFKLNRIGKLISRLLNYISPWIACASVLCVGRSLKEN